MNREAIQKEIERLKVENYSTGVNSTEEYYINGQITALEWVLNLPE